MKNLQTFNYEGLQSNQNGYLDYEFSDNSLNKNKRCWLVSIFKEEKMAYGSLLRSAEDEGDFINEPILIPAKLTKLLVDLIPQKDLLVNVDIIESQSGITKV